MSYITPAQLAEGPGMLRELAEPFGVAADLLSATISGADRSAWSADEIAVADSALASIEHTTARACAEMNAYLVKRGYALPLAASDFPVLTTWARNIARYHLQPQRDLTNEQTGRIERDYRGTLQALKAVAAGDIGLGPNDPLLVASSAGAGMPEYACEPRVFSRNSLDDF